jgi:hypothetical protein
MARKGRKANSVRNLRRNGRKTRGNPREARGGSGAGALLLAAAGIAAAAAVDRANDPTHTTTPHGVRQVISRREAAALDGASVSQLQRGLTAGE